MDKGDPGPVPTEVVGDGWRVTQWMLLDRDGRVLRASSNQPLGDLVNQLHPDDRAWFYAEWPRWLTESGTVVLRLPNSEESWHMQPVIEGVVLYQRQLCSASVLDEWPVGVLIANDQSAELNAAAQRLLDWPANPDLRDVNGLLTTSSEGPVYVPRTGLWVQVHRWDSEGQTTALILDVTDSATARIQSERFAAQAATVFHRQELIFYVLDPISGEAQLTGCWPGGHRPQGTETYATFLDLVHPEDRGALAQLHAEVRADAEGYLHRYRVNVGGTYREVADRVHRISRGKGKGSLLVGTIEAAVETSLGNFSIGRDFAHTARLVTLGELSASLAHEVNNPLAALTGHAELLTEHTDPEVAETGRQIIALAERAARIVARTRRLASPQVAEAELVNVDEIVAGAVEMLEHSFRKSNIVTSIQGSAGTAFLSATDLEQTILNLLVNARDALCDTPSPRVSISLARSQQTVSISVSNNGPAIPMSKRDEIFAPFFTTKACGKGTGLGLSISRRLMEAAGGSLELVPSQTGVTFVVTCPALARPQSAA